MNIQWREINLWSTERVESVDMKQNFSTARAIMKQRCPWNSI